MRLSAVILAAATTVALVPAVAAAQPPAGAPQPRQPADPAYLAKLLRSGQIAAEQGKCETAAVIGDKVAELDARYHAEVYAADAIIATCMDGIDRRQRPPGSFDAGAGAGEAEPLRAAGPERAMRTGGGTKSETTALALSLGGTIASYAVMVGAIAYGEDNEEGPMAGLATVGAFGAMFAPSFGHWYAGQFGTRGLALRGVASGLALTAMVWAFTECPLFGDHCEDSGGPKLLALGALGLWIGGTIDDIATAPGRVRDHNRRVTGLSIVPMVRSDGGSVALAGRF
jgi:hypothetical protein